MKDNLFLGESWSERLLGNKKTLLLYVLLIGALIFALVPFVKRFAGGSTTDFLKASIAYDRFSNDPSLLEALKVSIRKHTELETKFDALVARQLLIQGQGALAEEYGQRVMYRVKNGLPLHTQFAKTSLLIGKGDFQNALIEAKSLKEELDKNQEQSATEALFNLYNLLRIFALEREVGSPERLPIEELERAKERSLSTRQAYAMLEQNLKEGTLSLNDYLHQLYK